MEKQIVCFFFFHENSTDVWGDEICVLNVHGSKRQDDNGRTDRKYSFFFIHFTFYECVCDTNSFTASAETAQIFYGKLHMSF